MIGKKVATKQKIFEVSLQLFTQKGYGSTTIRDIAKAADISVGLLFHYFSNKQALLTAHLELAAYGIDSAMQLLESKQAPLKIFSQIAELTLGSMNETTPRLLYLLMNQPLPQDAINNDLQQKIRKDRVIVASMPVIKNGQISGEIKFGDAGALAVAFWSAIQGTAEILAEQPDTPIPDPDWLVDILRVK